MLALSIKCLNNVDPVIMVDDNRSDILMAERIYSRSDLENPFISFLGGYDFLDHMQKVRNEVEPCPSIVLMDINMPGIDGFETIVKLRVDLEFAQVPIICMLTNSDSARDKARAQEVGANSFHTKDYSIKDYVAFFNSLKADVV